MFKYLLEAVGSPMVPSLLSKTTRDSLIYFMRIIQVWDHAMINSTFISSDEAEHKIICFLERPQVLSREIPLGGIFCQYVLCTIFGDVHSLQYSNGFKRRTFNFYASSPYEYRILYQILGFDYGLHLQNLYDNIQTHKPISKKMEYVEMYDSSPYEYWILINFSRKTNE